MMGGTMKVCRPEGMVANSGRLIEKANRGTRYWRKQQRQCVHACIESLYSIHC